MSFIPDWKHAAESEAFNWKCMICSVLALSPMFVEDQWLVQYGPHKDIDGVTLWLKCSVLHTISSQVLTKLKRNWPWEIHLHFHGLQKIISFKLSILLPHFNSCLALIMLLFVCFTFSFVMSGRGHGKEGAEAEAMAVVIHHLSKPAPVPRKPQKGRKLNQWKTENMKNALAEFDREMQVISLLHQLL